MYDFRFVVKLFDLLVRFELFGDSFYDVRFLLLMNVFKYYVIIEI